MAARCRPATWRFVEGNDAPGSLTYVVTGGLDDLAAATATFSTRDGDRLPVVTDATATIGSIVTDDDGTKGCTLAVDLAASGLTAETGIQFGQFQVTYSDDTTVTVPAAPILTIHVEPAYRLLTAPA